MNTTIYTEYDITLNGTIYTEDDVIPQLHLIFNCIISTLIAMVAIPGNLIIIVIYIRYKPLRDLNNAAITTLAITDFLRSSIVMPIKIVSQATSMTSLNEPFCAITAVISAISFVLSPMLLALIAVIRYWTIVPKMKQCGELTRRKFHVINTVMITVALVFSILPYIDDQIARYGYNDAHGVCFADWRVQNKIYRTILYTLVMKLSFPVLIITYALLFIALHKHSKKFMTSSVATRNHRRNFLLDETTRNTEISTLACSSELTCMENGLATTGTPHKMSATTDQNGNISVYRKRNEVERTLSNDDQVAVIFEKKKSKVAIIRKIGIFKRLSKHEYHLTKILMLIVIAYIVCWLPATIVNHMKMRGSYISKTVLYFSVTCIELKSGLDPLIYGFGNKRYRIAFARLGRDMKSWFLRKWNHDLLICFNENSSWFISEHSGQSVLTVYLIDGSK